jgi:hypothetical protein
MLALLAMLAWTSSIGGPHGPAAGLVSVLYILLTSGPPALAYILGAIGLGMLFRPWTRHATDAASIECGLGLALMLSLSHGLGVLGLLSGTPGMILGGGAVLAGIVLLARRIMDHIRRTGGIVAGTVPWPVLLALPSAAVLLTAASIPPGWLWNSEHGGYDALSYHLQLPQEWIEQGRIWPQPHNVYSYLPGYIESAFVHIAALTGAPAAGRALSRPMGLLAGEGNGLLTCQLLHAAMTMLAAGLVGRWAWALSKSAAVGAVAGALFLSIPWVVVTGSLAYNEMGLAALFAAAMIAAGDTGLRRAPGGGWCVGLVCGVLIGVACGCKPTAIFMAAPLVGLALLFHSTVTGTRWTAIAGAMIGGLIAIAPWLIRNALANGNPVFPMATALFGNGHWSAEQVQRYITGHKFDGGLLARVAMIFDAGQGSTPPRGLLNAQWSLLPAVTVVAAIAALFSPARRRIAMVLGLGIGVQLGAWMLLTHLQSRFLLPIAVPACGLVALALAAANDLLKRSPRAPNVVLAVGAFVCIGQAGQLIGIYSAQCGGSPNLSLLESPWFRSGELDRRALAIDPARAATLAESGFPEVFINVLAPAGTCTYLLGEARALYYTGPVLYNTTWDAWPLGEAMRRFPGDPGAWTLELWNRGVRLVLFNEAEVARLHASGWADPEVTVEAAARCLQDQGRPVRSWPEIGVALFELRPPGVAR